MLKSKRTIILAALTLVTFIVFVAFISFKHSQTGLVTVAIHNILDQQGLRVSLNEKPLAAQSIGHLPLASGAYTLKVTKPDYQAFSTHFNVTTGQTTVINIVMHRTVNVPTITSWQQIKPPSFIQDEANMAGTPIIYTPTPVITQSVYFYGNGWAFLTATINASSSHLVVRYDQAAKDWDIILGPAGLFSAADLPTIPSNVADYLQANNYVDSGSS